MSDFQKFPKISRFFRDIIISEKIDGTNAQVYIKELTPGDDSETLLHDFKDDGKRYGMYAGSRSRLLTRTSDNYGFAKFVQENSAQLEGLGEGRHFGEWWGSGINRGYGFTGGSKFFSLFNVTRWTDAEDRPACVSVVPRLYSGPILNQAGELAVNDILRRMRFAGSQAAPGYKHAEGIVVFHTHGGFLQKISLDPEEDAGGKGTQ